MEVNHRTSVEPLPLESTLVPRRWEKVQEEGEETKANIQCTIKNTN